MIETISFYTMKNPPCKFSLFLERKRKPDNHTPDFNASPKIVQVLAYCLMPTHIHLILHQLIDNGITEYLNRVLKSYSKYFNVRYNRRGPLWEGRFKNVLVETEQQLIHLTRYIHLNPATACLVDTPMEWNYSSYREYMNKIEKKNKICNFSNFFEVNQSSYKNFVEGRIDYQRELRLIKDLIIE